MPAPQGILDTLGRMAATVGQGLGGAPARIWDELRPWMGDLSLHAAVKWLPRMAMGLPCQVPIRQRGQVVGACTGGAVAQCDACERTCCLLHSYISRTGDALCFVCVAEKVQAERRSAPERAAREAPPSPKPNGSGEEDEKWARRQLRVKAEATWDEVRAAYRAQSAKWHPDRHQGDAAKRKAEERFKAVQRAYQILRAKHEPSS